MKFLRPGMSFMLFTALSAAAVTSFSQQPAQPQSLPGAPQPQVRTTAYPARQVSASHRAALTLMFKSLHIDTIALRGMRQGVRRVTEQDPRLEAYIQDLFASVTPAGLLDRMVPIYAHYFSEQDAIAIAVFFNTPAGVKLATTFERDAISGRNFSLLNVGLDPAELQQTNKFAETPAALKFSTLKSTLAAETKEVLAAWSRELSQEKIKNAMQPFVQEIDAVLASRAEGASAKEGEVPAGQQAAGKVVTPATATELATGPATAPPAVSATDPAGGSAIWSEIAKIGVAATRRGQQAAQKYQQQLEQLGATSLLTPETLTSPTRIAAAKKNLALMGDALDGYLQSFDGILKDTREKVSGLVMSESVRQQLLKGIEVGQARVYDEVIRYGENQRTAFSVFARLLEFAESRAGKIRFEGDKLIFAEAADQQIYRDFLIEIDAGVKREAALAKESTERVQSSTRMFR